MKKLSNEQLVAAYRESMKLKVEQETIRILKTEIQRRGITPTYKAK